MANDTIETLGRILGEYAGRDAVHIAVEPVVAGEALSPGQHIGIQNGKACADVKHLGIVDPFLAQPVKRGERFWMFVYPRTITSLRHVWEHPELLMTSTDAPKPVLNRKESEKWLRDFCRRGNNPPYEYLIQAFMREGEFWIATECTGEIPMEMWHHLEVVTGLKAHDKPQCFHCAC